MQWILSVFYFLLILSVFTVILVDKGDSGRKFAWLLIIAVLPVVGLVLYFMFGINYRHHWIFNRRHQRYRDIFEAGTTPELNRILFGHDNVSAVKEEFRPLARLLGADSYPSVTSGNDVEIITSGQRKFDLLREDILAAKESIHIEYFHFGNDKGSKEIKRLLMQKAREGIKVRFLYENIANFPIASAYYNNMRKAGVDVVKFTNPRMHVLDFATKLNYRNHRKIVVIDGKIGYTGGMNINDHYFRQWRDTHLRMTGDAVAVLQYTFLDSWLTGGGTIDKPMIDFYPMVKKPAPATETEASATEPKTLVAEPVEVTGCANHIQDNVNSMVGEPCRTAGSATGDADSEIDFHATHPILKGKLMQIVPDEPDLPLPILQMSYEWALQHAKKYIYLQTPYFVPTEPVMDALKTAALCGVDVRLMLPEVADNLLMRPANRAYYEEALQAGVRIFLRKGEFIHAKTFVCDDYLSSIGSANLDFRSFAINYEVNAYIYDEQTARMNKGIFMYDLRQCHELTLEEWNARPWYSRILESFMRLFAPLL
ncbi:MAG TPA: hypothetical protein DDX40_03935 [Rikenellaceae bacterium]|nr:hypothetical protein [Rikenellaceae bacterium]